MLTIPTWILATICSIFTISPIATSFFNKNPKHIKLNRILSAVGFTLYSCLVALLTLTETQLTATQTIINFSASSKWFSKHLSLSFYENTLHTIINCAMLLPLGSITTQNVISNKSKHPILKSLALGLVVGTTIETLQFILPINRTPDVTDVLMNTISCGLGATLSSSALFLQKLKRQKTTTNKYLKSEEILKLSDDYTTTNKLENNHIHKKENEKSIIRAYSPTLYQRYYTSTTSLQKHQNLNNFKYQNTSTQLPYNQYNLNIKYHDPFKNNDYKQYNNNIQPNLLNKNINNTEKHI